MFPPQGRERCSPAHINAEGDDQEKPRHSGLGMTHGQYASNAEGDDDGKNHRYAESHCFR